MGRISPASTVHLLRATPVLSFPLTEESKASFLRKSQAAETTSPPLTICQCEILLGMRRSFDSSLAGSPTPLWGPKGARKIRLESRIKMKAWLGFTCAYRPVFPELTLTI